MCVFVCVGGVTSAKRVSVKRVPQIHTKRKGQTHATHEHAERFQKATHPATIQVANSGLKKRRQVYPPHCLAATPCIRSACLGRPHSNPHLRSRTPPWPDPWRASWCRACCRLRQQTEDRVAYYYAMPFEGMLTHWKTSKRRATHPHTRARTR